MQTRTHLPLTTSFLTYPLLLRLLTGPSPTATRYTAALKATSTLHSLLITTLSLTFLHKQRSKWPHTSPRPAHLHPDINAQIAPKGAYPDDSHNPTITAQSGFGNAIAGIEAGYLIQDTFALLLKAHIYRNHQHADRRGVLDKMLLAHHTTIASLLLVLQYYITHKREAGIYIIVQLLLMNASTPLMNLRWCLRTFAPGRKRAVLATDVLFAAAFFVARVGLVWIVLRDYGGWHGMGALEAYLKALRVPCQLGTGALLVVNLGWWGMVVRNLVARLRKGGWSRR